MKNCEEKWKLKKDIEDAKNKLRSIFPFPANGRLLTVKTMENIKRLRQEVLDCKEKHNNHIKSCFICNKSM